VQGGFITNRAAHLKTPKLAVWDVEPGSEKHRREEANHQKRREMKIPRLSILEKLMQKTRALQVERKDVCNAPANWETHSAKLYYREGYADFRGVQGIPRSWTRLVEKTNRGASRPQKKNGPGTLWRAARRRSTTRRKGPRGGAMLGQRMTSTLNERADAKALSPKTDRKERRRDRDTQCAKYDGGQNRKIESEEVCETRIPLNGGFSKDPNWRGFGRNAEMSSSQHANDLETERDMSSSPFNVLIQKRE